MYAIKVVLPKSLQEKKFILGMNDDQKLLKTVIDNNC